eukprot:7758857-Pyramimonas_sp.AAC.1
MCIRDSGYRHCSNSEPQSAFQKSDLQGQGSHVVAWRRRRSLAQEGCGAHLSGPQDWVGRCFGLSIWVALSLFRGS